VFPGNVRDNAPETGEHGRHHHEFEATVFDAASAHRVAHDDERSCEHQKRHRSECLRARSLRQQSEAGGPSCEMLIDADQRAGEGEADADGNE
jgi:hypothetical protein